MNHGNRREFAHHDPGGWRARQARHDNPRRKTVQMRQSFAINVVEIVFDGAGGPVLDKTPDFLKSLPLLDRDLLDKARHHDHGGDEAIRRVLDEVGLSDSDWEIPPGHALPIPRDRNQYASKAGSVFNASRLSVTPLLATSPPMLSSMCWHRRAECRRDGSARKIRRWG
jgi:hypothetical protein